MATITDYNEAMSRGSGPAQRSGWRRSVEQFARFEYVLLGWDWSQIDRILDLGCGTGELAGWMTRTERRAEYIGVDCREKAIDEARRRHPEATFVIGDLYDVCRSDIEVDLTLAIGTLIDGEPPSDDDDRRRRVRRLVDAAVRPSRVGAVVAALNQQVVRTRPSLALEPALFGVEPDSFERILGDTPPAGWSREIGGNLLSTDLVGTVWCGDAFGATPHAEREEQACHRATGASEVGPLDEAWLWLKAGRADRARDILQAEPQSSSK